MDVLEKSIIVVAHPDDENLWFSSIFAKVDTIILCFLSVDSEPEWTKGRRQSLVEYPLNNVSCLELKEAEVFWGVDWSRPIPTGYGLKITENRLSDVRYRHNFNVLKDNLRKILRGYKNVFTHNPWGEYGHVEHVQVYRAVQALQEEMGFGLWFTNYVSNKSIYLMGKEYFRIGPHLKPFKTNKRLAELVAGMYKQNNCWTWYNDYQWCDEEVFIRSINTTAEKGRCGKSLPLQLIDVGVDQPPVQKSIVEKLILKIRRKVAAFGTSGIEKS